MRTQIALFAIALVSAAPSAAANNQRTVEKFIQTVETQPLKALKFTPDRITINRLTEPDSSISVVPNAYFLYMLTEQGKVGPISSLSCAAADASRVDCLIKRQGRLERMVYRQSFYVEGGKITRIHINPPESEGERG